MFSSLSGLFYSRKKNKQQTSLIVSLLIQVQKYNKMHIINVIQLSFINILNLILILVRFVFVVLLICS